jgi:hypothetical protein
MMDDLMGVITLKAATYRKIADDKSLTTMAAIIVVVVTLIAGFFEGLVRVGTGGTAEISIVAAIAAAIVGVIVGLITWVVGAWILAFVAKSFFQGKTDTSEMLRVTGYVHVFNLVSVLTILGAIATPLLCIVSLVGFVAGILRLIGYVIGVREAAEFSTTNAIITAVIAIVVELVIVLVIGGLLLGLAFAALGVAAAVGATQ